MDMPHQARQLAERDREMIPIVLVRAMFILALFSLVLVAYARLTDRPLVGVAPDLPIVAEMSITLDHQPDETVLIRDETGAVIANSAENRAGFIATVWRVVDRERMKHGADRAAPLRLVRRDNGKVAILDPETGWNLELIGYGPDNVAAFARLID